MKEVGKVPSRAVLVHDWIYKENPDINAVLLAHPPYAMAFAVTDAVFDPRTIPESYILLRDIEKHPFSEFYVDPKAVADSFAPNRPALVFQNDSVIVTGSTLLQAFDRMEVLESTAHSILNSTSIGKIVHISKEEVDDLKKAFNLID